MRRSVISQIPLLLTVLLVTIMVGISEIMNEKEIIFPEITALAVGTLIAPTISWRTSRIRMVVLIAICSVFGLGMVVFVSIPIWLKIIVGYIFCNILYIYSGTSFAPLISAAILPILMGTESIIYPISSVIFTFTIIILEYILIKTKCKVKEEYIKVPAPGRAEYINLIKRILIVSIISFIMIKWVDKFVIAPPLMVAFTEFSNINSNARKKPLNVVFLVTVCAMIGVIARLIICNYFGEILTIAAALTTICVVSIMKFMKMYIPPAGALGILPMLIPEDKLYIYPVEIFAGISLFMMCALAFFRKNIIDDNGKL